LDLWSQTAPSWLSGAERSQLDSDLTTYFEFI
jgi:hypothetical protein